MQNRKILIISYYYFPEITPRAFRTYELAQEFIRQNCFVKIILPNKEIYQSLTLERNVEFKFNGNKISKSILAPNIKGKIRKLLSSIYNYFFPGLYLKFVFETVLTIRNDINKYDYIIAIGLPISPILATAIALYGNKVQKNCISIADYGDPFSRQQNTRIFPGYFLVDKFIGKVFKFIAVPTEKAINSYIMFKPYNEIKVIPQGFNFEKIKTSEYKKNINGRINFAYAGVFYEKIRNPEFLFEHLFTLENFNFVFHIYTLSNNSDTKYFINKYSSLLKNKINIIYDVPRIQLIYELSKMDFLINLDNNTSNQIPSKLIDYSFTKRPIYSFNQESFNPKALIKFLNAEYDEQTFVDIRKYNIKNIVESFLMIGE